MFDSIHWHIYGFTNVVDKVTGLGVIGKILGDMRVEPSVIPIVAAIAYGALILITYFIGNISPSTLMAKSKGMDIKAEGSGNAGTTNALRVMGRKAGIITLVIDILKGFTAVILAEILAGEACGMYCAVAVIVGHIWPVVYRFRGGKGVATTFGALMAINPVLGLLELAVVAVFVLISKRMSAGSIAGAIAFPLFCLFNEPEFIVMGTLLAIIILIKHRANIVRLLEGREPKLGFFEKDKKEDAESEPQAGSEVSDEPESKPEAESEADVKPEVESESAVESEQEAPEESEIIVDSEPDAADEPESKPEEKSEADVKSEEEPEAAAESEAEPEAAAASEQEAPDESEITVESEPDTADEPESKPEEKPETDAESEAEPEAAAGKDKNTGAKNRNNQKRNNNNKKSNTKKNGKKKKTYPNKKKNGTKQKNRNTGKGGHKNSQSKSKGKKNNKKKGGKKK